MRFWVLLTMTAALALDGFADSHVYAPLPATYLSSLDATTKELSLIRREPDSSIQLAAGSDNTIFLATGFPGVAESYNPGTGAFTRFKTTFPAVGYGGLAVSPDGSLLFVATCSEYVQAQCYENYLEEIEVSSGAEIGIVSFGPSEISGLTDSPSGEYLYVADFYYDQSNSSVSAALSGLTVFSVPNLTPVASLEGIGLPAVAPSSSYGYVLGTDGKIWVLALPGLQVERKVSALGEMGDLFLSQNGAILCSLASSANRQFPYDVPVILTSLTCFSAPSLVEIGTVTLPDTRVPSTLVLSSDGSSAYSPAASVGVITGVNTASMTIFETLPAGAPEFVLPSSSESAFYVSQAAQSVLGVFPEGGGSANSLLPVATANSLSLSPGGDVLYVSQASGFNGYSTKRGKLLRRYLPNVYVGAAVPTPDGKKLIAAGIDAISAVSNVYILDLISGEIKLTTPIPSPTAGPFSVSVPAHGAKVCIAPNGYDGGGPVQVFDLEQNTFLALGAEETENCVIDPTGTFVYVSDPAGGIDVFNATTGSQIGAILNVEFPVVFSPTAKVAYAISAGGTAVIDTSTNTVLSTVPTSRSYYAYMAITSDGAYLYETPKDYTGEKTGVGIIIDLSAQKVIGDILATGPMVAN